MFLHPVILYSGFSLSIPKEISFADPSLKYGRQSGWLNPIATVLIFHMGDDL